MNHISLSWLCRVWLLCLLVAPTVAAQYRFDNWTTEHGLPQNSVISITQTRDGYLWLATYNGVVRFDGVHFTVFNRNNTPALGTNRICGLGEDAAGALWMSTIEGGVVRYQHGVFTRFTREQGLPHNNVMMGLRISNTGVPLFFTDAGAVWRRDDSFQPYEVSGTPKDMQIHFGASGTQWLADKDGVTARKNGQATRYPMPITSEAVPGVRCHEDRSGALWLALPQRGLFRLKDGRVTDYNERIRLRLPATISVILEDRDGALWLGTPDSGLIHFRPQAKDKELSKEQDTVTVYSTSNGLPSRGILELFQDREGIVWVGTNTAGLVRITPQFIAGYSEAQGLDGNVTDAIVEDHAGNVWIVTQAGLGKITNGVVTNYVPGKELGVPPPLQTLHENRDGGLWLGGWTGLFSLKNGAFSKVIPNINVHALHQDRQGDLWIGSHEGLVKYRDGAKQIWKTGDGLPHDIIRVIHESQHESRQGTLWIGTAGGLAQFRDGRFTVFTTKDGLVSDHVWSIHEDEDGVLWIGTADGGLSRFQDGRFTNYTTAEGLYDNGVFQILEDTRGYFWISCYRGLYRVSKQQLNDYAAGKIKSVTSQAFGRADGMLSAECNGGRQPSGARTRDGKLWFATLRGVAVLDPEAMPVNPLVPPALIEGATIDRRAADFAQGLRIQPGQSNLEINYTAPSFIKAEQTRFKYQMVGQDTDWVDAGTRRAANYSYLRPGQYTFKVIAANSDGVWNTAGAELTVTVLPAFYQTWWFRLLLAVSLFGSIGLIFKRRLDHAHRARQAQEEFSRRLIDSQEAERKRIAAELHDSLGQNLLVIKNYALMGLSTAQADNPMREHLNEISDAAALSIEEVRQIAHNLRPYQLERLGLTNTLQFMLRQIANASDIGFDCEVEDIDGLLSKDDEISFYRIVQEAINNILKHSRANEARIRIRREGDEIQATIADDGQGFVIADFGLRSADSVPSSTPQSITHNPKLRGFGLTGSAERVRMLGGKQTIQSAPGQGTTIQIWIPIDKHADTQ